MSVELLPGLVMMKVKKIDYSELSKGIIVINRHEKGGQMVEGINEGVVVNMPPNQLVKWIRVDNDKREYEEEVNPHDVIKVGDKVIWSWYTHRNYWEDGDAFMIVHIKNIHSKYS